MKSETVKLKFVADFRNARCTVGAKQAISLALYALMLLLPLSYLPAFRPIECIALPPFSFDIRQLPALSAMKALCTVAL